MCGIFGYVGPKNASDVVLEGLKRLEYRGYDSWGIAVSDGERGSYQISLKRRVGAIGDLKSDLGLPKAFVSIGHTRWATTGAVTDVNAHPHYSSDKSFALAQNGIVENYQKLKDELIKKGYKFESQTDTEVIVRLVEDKQAPHLGSGKVDLKNAVRISFLELEGRNTIILITKDGTVIGARNGSPLVIGKNFETGEIYLSSDTLSFAPYAKKMLVLDNGQMVIVKDQDIKILEIKTGKEVEVKFEDIGFEAEKIDKEGFPHFMLKEIYEAPIVVNQIINQNEKAYEDLAKAVKLAKNVYTIGSGGAGVAAAQVAFYLRAIGKIKAISLIGSDAVEYEDLFTKDDLIIVISQSGETADVLEVIEPAEKKGVKIASFVNMPGSMITRLSDYKFMSQSGPEICVMSTKTFDAQIAFGYLLASVVSGQAAVGRENLKKLAAELEKYLEDQKNHQQLKETAKKLIKQKDIFLFGKYQNFHIIREGMVKIIEATYKHGHALPSGDLKHYVITLIEKGVPIIVAVSEDKVKTDLLSAIQQVKARGAYVLAIASKPHPDFDIFLQVPDCGELSSIMNLIPLQLLAYYMAVELGNNVDKPRNIAKSVTVK